MSKDSDNLPKLKCLDCDKVVELEEEEWWGAFVFCKKCNAVRMEEYKEYMTKATKTKTDL